MSEDDAAEEAFVFPLHFRHLEQAIGHVRAAAGECEGRGLFVFDDVRSFEPARAVHRDEPASDVAQHADRSTDEPEDRFPQRVWPRAEVAQQSDHQFPMVPLLRLDDLNPRALRFVAHAAPVAAVRVSGRELAGTGALQLPDQFQAVAVSRIHGVSLRRCECSGTHGQSRARHGATNSWSLLCAPRPLPERPSYHAAAGRRKEMPPWGNAVVAIVAMITLARIYSAHRA